MSGTAERMGGDHCDDRVDLQSAWARLFVRALVASGVHDFVVSPGSRSTPLALAADSDAPCSRVVVDERAAAFFALGQARASGRPSVLICTSGTAGGHYLPAVIEASQSFLPLIVVTANRPWEAFDAASSQTIDQVKLFGDHVRHFCELGEPHRSVDALRAVSRVAAQAVYRSRSPTPGPVHIDARFRKPLEPVDVGADPARSDAGGVEAWELELESLLSGSHRPPTRAFAPEVRASAAAIDALADACLGARRGAIVCGPFVHGAGAGIAGDTQGDALRAAIGALAGRTGFPILAEATSGVRFGLERGETLVLGAFDVLFKSEAFRQTHAPDVTLEIGLPTTSAGYAAVTSAPRCPGRHVVAPHGWPDPPSTASSLVVADPGELARALVSRLGDRRPHVDGEWRRSMVRADAAVWSAVASAVSDDAAGALTEAHVARALVDALPEGATLVAGNSGPVRALDAYVPVSTRALRVLHQRGANGIDGLVAGAAGARSVTEGPLALLLGDVSLLHDVGALDLARDAHDARSARGPLVIVVVENGGGRIFEDLPIGGSSLVDRETFTRLFTTPPRLRIDHAAAAFGLGYARVESPRTLAVALSRALASAGCTIIEAVVCRNRDTNLRARVRSEVARIVTEAVQP